MSRILHLKIWAGPLTIGSFGVVAVTGVLMLFHMNAGLVKLAHEWVGLLLVVGGVAHVAVNWKPFVGYFRKPSAVAIVGVLVLLGAASFFPSGGHGGPPMMQASAALELAPLDVVAQVANASPESLIEKLEARGIRVRDGRQTLREIAAENGVRGMEILGHVFEGRESLAGGRLPE
jgi:hypothetical protein